METLVIKIEEESKISKIKEFLESMKVSFTSKKKAEKPYNPAFVERILKSREEYKEGKYTSIKTEDLWK